MGALALKTEQWHDMLQRKGLAIMRRIARFCTENEFEGNISRLKNDDKLWGQSLFRKWFEKTWLRQQKVSIFFLRS